MNNNFNTTGTVRHSSLTPSTLAKIRVQKNRSTYVENRTLDIQCAMTGSAFSLSAEAYRKAGITTIPVTNKVPRISKFNKWNMMSEESLGKLVKQFFDADIAILTRVSRLLVIDIDSKDDSLLELVISKIGKTPIIISTKNGFHLYYRNPKNLIGAIKCGPHPIDVKGAGKSDYVVAPPTKGYVLHSNIKDSIIDLLTRPIPNLDLLGFKELFPNHPAFRIAATEKGKGKPERRQERAPKARTAALPYISDTEVLEEGHRNYGLFIRGLQKAVSISNKNTPDKDCLNLLEEHLLQVNISMSKPQLPTSEVIAIAYNVWNNYELKGLNYFHKSQLKDKRDVTLTGTGIIESLKEPNTFALLQWLVSHYDNTQLFPLSREGLCIILGWTEGKTRRQIMNLRQAELVMQVHKKKNGYAARYQLTDKVRSLMHRNPVKQVSNDNITSVRGKGGNK